MAYLHEGRDEAICGGRRARVSSQPVLTEGDGGNHLECLQLFELTHGIATEEAGRVDGDHHLQFEVSVAHDGAHLEEHL